MSEKKTLNVRVIELENTVPGLMEKMDALAITVNAITSTVNALAKNINGTNVTEMNNTVDRLELLIDGDKEGHDVVGIRNRIETIEESQKKIQKGVTFIIAIILLSQLIPQDGILTLLSNVLKILSVLP